MEFTINTYKTLNIMQSYVKDENIAFMILNDSFHLDAKLGERDDLEDVIKSLRQKIGKANKKAHKSIAYQKRVFGFTCEEMTDNFKKLKTEHEEKFYKAEKTEIVKTVKKYLRDVSNSSDANVRANTALALFKFITNNTLFLILNSTFHKTVLAKINEFENREPLLQDNVEFKKYAKMVKEL